MVTSYFWSFGIGFARSEFRVTIWHGNEEDQGIYTFDEGAYPKCIETIKKEDGESLADLKACLEGKKALKFEFQYWDPYENCRVTTGLESFNDLEDKVFMIHNLYETCG